VGRNRPSYVIAPSPCPVLLYSSCPCIGLPKRETDKPLSFIGRGHSPSDLRPRGQSHFTYLICTASRGRYRSTFLGSKGLMSLLISLFCAPFNVCDFFFRFLLPALLSSLLQCFKAAASRWYYFLLLCSFMSIHINMSIKNKKNLPKRGRSGSYWIRSRVLSKISKNGVPCCGLV
jgi:hypothetical protein